MHVRVCWHRRCWPGIHLRGCWHRQCCAPAAARRRRWGIKSHSRSGWNCRPGLLSVEAWEQPWLTVESRATATVGSTHRLPSAPFALPGHFGRGSVWYDAPQTRRVQAISRAFSIARVSLSREQNSQTKTPDEHPSSTARGVEIFKHVSRLCEE